MSAMLIVAMLVSAWLAICLAMLWGMLRLTRRRHPATRTSKPEKLAPAGRHAHGH